jgi:hypothetical protein
LNTDNAYDPEKNSGAGASTLTIDVEMIANTSCLTFYDNAMGMTEDVLYDMLR